jgi:serine/threonine protein kinase HipA of HipAB toxin-antitoxin module
MSTSLTNNASQEVELRKKRASEEIRKIEIARIDIIKKIQEIQNTKKVQTSIKFSTFIRKLQSISHSSTLIIEIKKLITRSLSEKEYNKQAQHLLTINELLEGEIARLKR